MKHEEEDSHLWRSFYGMANTHEVLVNKAQFVAPVILHICAGACASLQEDLKKLGNKLMDVGTENSCFQEFVGFYVNILDREAFAALGDKSRSVFVDALVLELTESVSRLHNSGLSAAIFRREFISFLNERQAEYGQLPSVYPDDQKSPQGTLYWEFSKRIAELANHAGDARLILPTMITAITSLDAFDLSGLINCDRLRPQGE